MHDHRVGHLAEQWYVRVFDETDVVLVRYVDHVPVGAVVVDHGVGDGDDLDVAAAAPVAVVLEALRAAPQQLQQLVGPVAWLLLGQRQRVKGLGLSHPVQRPLALVVLVAARRDAAEDAARPGAPPVVGRQLDHLAAEGRVYRQLGADVRYVEYVSVQLRVTDGHRAGVLESRRALHFDACAWEISSFNKILNGHKVKRKTTTF